MTDAHVSLVKNPDYHVAGLPKLAGLKFNIVPEASTRQAGMASGAYQFNLAVQPNQTYYIDPDVAVGYDYATGAGDPNFKSVVLPTGIGDGHYQLWGFNGSTPVLLVADLAGGTPYSFASGGVSRFRVTGIETSAGLDPTSTTAFVTGLDFVGSGKFTGTQTPITLSVPETATVALWALGLVAIRQRRYRARI